MGSSLNYVGEVRAEIIASVPLCLCGWVRAHIPQVAFLL
ncbi:hypothetical protein ASZ90_012153 [hydrocarbon metagenome]|uniref:Uncharacterized protein n=1 Tax=hydrocarbon metagenome TaxID=938273 RepID=A0A0W8FB86_9ZZZZ